MPVHIPAFPYLIIETIFYDILIHENTVIIQAHTESPYYCIKRFYYYYYYHEHLVQARRTTRVTNSRPRPLNRHEVKVQEERSSEI